MLTVNLLISAPVCCYGSSIAQAAVVVQILVGAVNGLKRDKVVAGLIWRWV